ncbi:cyanamide hydratase, partial [Umbelopsis sp. PMI_123]
PIDIASIYVPSTPLTEKVVRYANDMLHPAVFNHSNRVYYFGTAIVQDYLPQWKFKWEDYYLTSILHDIGFAPSLHLSSPLSFEFLGGIHAREKLVEFGAPQFQADEVAEAIIRHNDRVNCNNRQSGRIIQMSTTIDVSGRNPQWFHPHTIDQTVQKFPRLGFNYVFADVMAAECENKPGCNMSKYDGETFLELIKTNPVMAKYDGQ